MPCMHMFGCVVYRPVYILKALQHHQAASIIAQSQSTQVKKSCTPTRHRCADISSSAKKQKTKFASFERNSSQWARTTNLPVCWNSEESLTAERATGCASEDAD